MRRIPTPLATALALFFLAGGASAIEFHPDLPADQVESLQYDLATLERLAPLRDSDSEAAARLLGISGKLSGRKLRNWIEERVHFIVPQDWNFRRHFHMGEKFVAYPNADLLPTIEVATHQPADGAGQARKGVATTVMANIGGEIYLDAKEDGRVMTIDIDPLHSVPVLSPRVGIVKIGQAFFSDSFRIDPESANTPANSIYRLATLFHEAHHSDGNGASLAFFHAVCPDEPRFGKYSGLTACDRNQNGPYAVGAAMLKVMINQCTGCSEGAKEILRAKLADMQNRVLETTPGVLLDARPEALDLK
jgi:hypothetical protein